MLLAPCSLLWESERAGGRMSGGTLADAQHAVLTTCLPGGLSEWQQPLVLPVLASCVLMRALALAGVGAVVLWYWSRFGCRRRLGRWKDGPCRVILWTLVFIGRWGAGFCGREVAAQGRGCP